jgi:O-antigen/teichoic acid export membrane protein
MMSLGRVKRLAREFLWIGLGQAVATLGGLVGVSLLTRALRPERYGELALGMTVATLTQQVFLGPVSGALLRFFAPAAEAGELNSFLRGGARLLSRATLILMGFGVLLALALLNTGQTQWMGLMMAALLFSLLSGYNSAMDGIQNAARQRSVVAWHQGIGQWLRFSAALLLILEFGAASTPAMLGYVTGSALVLGSQMVFFRRKILTLLPARDSTWENDGRDWTPRMRTYAWPFAIWGLFTWAQMASDRWALQLCGSASEVGRYAALYQLGFYPMTLLSGFMVQLASPVLFSRAGDGTSPDRIAQSQRLNRMLFLGSIGLGVAGAMFALLFHNGIFSLLAAPGYRQVSPLLPVMVLSGGLFAAGQVAVLSLLSGVNSQRLMAPKIVMAVLGVLLNFGGAFWLGIVGVVYAGLAVSLGYLVWILILVKREHVRNDLRFADSPST